MSRRITGLETEYGCLIAPPRKIHEVLPRIRDWFFDNERYGLVDVHHRDWDEPMGNGGFLFNGGRLYIDMGHLEYCTPECLTVADVIRYDRAGDMMLMQAVRELGMEGEVTFIRNNIDHHTGATFGCHENYSMERRAPLTERNVLSLLAFLTLRLLLTGAGRVGAGRSRLHPEEDVPEIESTFHVSQRADYIQNDFYEWVQQNRAIINTRDEPLADPAHHRRLHLLHGDTSVSPATLALKVGSTRLVLDLLEADALPAVELANATLELRRLSRQISPPWTVTLADHSEADALEILSRYQQRAAELFTGRDAETDNILQLWSQTIEKLAANETSALIGAVDWIGKNYLLDEFRRTENLPWNHPWLEAQDLEFHNCDPAKSLGLGLAALFPGWEPENVAGAMLVPPGDTRAHARSRLMREIQAGDRTLPYVLDWDGVSLAGGRTYPLLDPFQA